MFAVNSIFMDMTLLPDPLHSIKMRNASDRETTMGLVLFKNIRSFYIHINKFKTSCAIFFFFFVQNNVQAVVNFAKIFPARQQNKRPQKEMSNNFS